MGYSVCEQMIEVPELSREALPGTESEPIESCHLYAVAYRWRHPRRGSQMIS